MIRLRNFHLLPLETFPHLAVVLGLLVVVGEDLLQPGLGVSALLKPEFVVHKKAVSVTGKYGDRVKSGPKVW